ncbi:ABC transporter substrate-binding protein [uncultured Pigmentiphaga sp.]|jgi:ABC-type nitrate/sulfonate/bicarbonate transport systems, periplasmic components|uniref:ABC transporter substrate-binding protein n=1 Tax=uncultured Pigmentiphaga sp. TaxID=340361 RepID=UPI00262B601B|nr:ABC transporter substrate-binding protein [uncultured Pigmentiphaga sp.]
MKTTLRTPSRRIVLAGAALILASTWAASAQAQNTKIRFQLDWRFEGPSAIFLVAEKKGYFKEEKLDVTIDAGNGSGAAVNRVASGAYEMGFADLAALMEFQGNNPGAPNQPMGVMMIYNNTPAAVFSLKKSGIKTPKDLEGKKIGAPSFDGGRRSFPIFAQANKIDDSKVNWVSMDPALRETMLARGDVDAITGFYFTSLLNLNARGITDQDIAIMSYPEYGVKLYGNAIIADRSFAKKNPEAVKGFLRAVTKATRDVLADPAASIATVKERDGIIDTALELKRLRLAIQTAIDTPDARADGFGDITPARMALMAAQVTRTYGTKATVDPEAAFDRSFLPAKSLTGTVLRNK